MTSSVPAVSVTLITYNHEKYIGEAIRSVLGQTFADLELVVVDDGSTDDTPRVIASFDDPRLVSIRQENQGPSAAANRALRSCRARYIALMSGDDVCHPDRVARQLEAYQSGPTRLLFSPVNLIDDDGRPLMRPSFFDPFHQGRAAIYRRFFHVGNFINAITCFTETDVLLKAGFCNPFFLQLQDFDLWIRLIKQYDFTFLPQSILNYRIRAGEQNLSGSGADRLARTTNELYFIIRHFFDGVSPELFREAFHDKLQRPDCTHPLALRCEQALLLARAYHPAYQLAGIEKLQELLEDAEGAAVLRRDYQFDVPTFYRLLGELTVFNTADVSTLFYDIGGGFNEVSASRTRVNPDTPRFEITFELTGTPTVQQLRWDPFEGRLGQVQVESVVWQTPEGRQGEMDVAGLSANGVRGKDGFYTFDTPDPSFLLPYAGPLSQLTVRGQWKVQPAQVTLNRFLSLQNEHNALRAELARRQEELARCEEQLHCIVTSRRWKAADRMHSLWRLLRGRRSA